MNEVKFNKFFARLCEQIPRKIDDLTPRQFIRIAGVLFTAGKMDNEKKFWILLYLMGVKRWSIWVNLKVGLLDELQFIELASFSDFLFDPGNKTELCFVPSLKYRFKTFNGPGSRLSNITFGQFAQACDFLDGFTKNNKVASLDKFIATLYTRAGDGNNSDRFRERVVCISKVPLNVKIAVYYNWLLFMSYLQGLFPHLFKRGKGGASNVLWIDIVSEWSGFKPEAEDEKYSRNVMQVLHSLNHQNKTATLQNIKKQLKK